MSSQWEFFYAITTGAWRKAVKMRAINSSAGKSIRAALTCASVGISQSFMVVSAEATRRRMLARGSTHLGVQKGIKEERNERHVPDQRYN